MAAQGARKCVCDMLQISHAQWSLWGIFSMGYHTVHASLSLLSYIVHGICEYIYLIQHLALCRVDSIYKATTNVRE